MRCEYFIRETSSVLLVLRMIKIRLRICILNVMNTLTHRFQGLYTSNLDLGMFYLKKTLHFQFSEGFLVKRAVIVIVIGVFFVVDFLLNLVPS